MEITISTQSGRVPVKVVHIHGDIDASSYAQLQTFAKQEIDGGARQIVLDLEHVPYVSSWGIRAISQIFNWLRDAAGDESASFVSHGVRDGSYQSHHLKVASPSPHVLKVLTDTGVDMYIPIMDSVQTAVDSFG